MLNDRNKAKLRLEQELNKYYQKPAYDYNTLNFNTLTIIK